MTLPRGVKGDSGVDLGEVQLVQDFSTEAGSENKVLSQKAISEKIQLLENVELEYIALYQKDGYTLNSNGEEEISVNWGVTDFFKVTKQDKLLIDGFPDSYGTIFIYDLRKNFVRAYLDENANKNSRYLYNMGSILIDNDICYIRVSVRNGNIETKPGQIYVSKAVQIRNDIYDDLEHIFSNNAFCGNVVNGYLSLDGTKIEEQNNQNWITTDYIPVYLGEFISYRGVSPAPHVGALYATYDENRELISVMTSQSGMTEDSATLPIDKRIIKYVRFSTRSMPGDVKELNIISSTLPNNSNTINLGNNLSNKNINYVGMSIWFYDGNIYPGTSEKQVGYQHYLNRKFMFKSNTGTKYCYSGASLGGNSVSDDSCIMNKSSSWAHSDNAIWTLDTITNDFKRNIPIGTINDYNSKTGVTTFYGALREFKDKIYELSGSDAIIVVSNALRRNNDEYTSNSENTVGATLIDYEKAIVEIARLNGWYFVDQYRMSGINEEILMLVTHDGLHLNNLGYKLAVLPWIATIELL